MSAINDSIPPRARMDPIIGIDLGTTNSAAAHLAEDGPRLIPNALGTTLTPSVVAIDAGGKLLVGAAAKELQVVEPGRCAALFKRQMGSDWSVTLAGRSFNPEELSSLVLRSLKADAEAFFRGPVTRAVITVPAYFNDRQRKATIAAGKIAGLDVARILNEPTAAAVAYGFHEAKEDKTLLIFDLGGGTFDVSIVEFFDGTLEVKASSGESVLGGEDFTRAMAARILEGFKLNFERAEAEMPLMVSRLVQQCEVAKCRLTTQETAVVRVPDRKGNFPDDAAAVTVTRAQMEAWVTPALARIELPVRRVLGDAGLTRERVDEVILVGGATRMPLVVKRVTELMGKPPQCRLNPDEVVAMGAAVQAGLVGRSAAVEDLVVTDVAPFTLGVEIGKEFGHEFRSGYFLPVIDRNTTIPASRVQRVGTVAPNQTAVKVRVFQGEARRVEDNLCLGEFEVTGLPPGPAGQPVDIRFTYDLNGVLEVEAVIVVTGKKVNHLITRNARHLTPEQIRRAVRDMEKLKVHPREEEANRFLLLRAERLYQELDKVGRERLGELLDHFETALGRQDPEVIDPAREALQMFLSQFDAGAGEASDD
jgi:molecular chaperone HscC